MIRIMIVASALVAATALSPATPAAATAPPAMPLPSGPAAQQARRTDLTLSYMAEAGYAAAVKLRCDPAGGAHPKPIQACDELKKVGGRPDRLQPARIMCMLIYAPVTAEITGTWKGRKIDWSKTYGNSCEMSRATGVLFRF
jgi:hypothetical protein